MKHLVLAVCIAVAAAEMSIMFGTTGSDWIFDGKQGASNLTRTGSNQGSAISPIQVANDGTARCDREGGCTFKINAAVVNTAMDSWTAVFSVSPVSLLAGQTTGQVTSTVQQTFHTGATTDISCDGQNCLTSVDLPLGVDVNPRVYDGPSLQEFQVSAQLYHEGHLVANDTVYVQANFTEYWMLSSTAAAGQSYFTIDPANAKQRFNTSGLTAPFTVTCTGAVSCSDVAGGAFTKNSPITVVETEEAGAFGVFYAKIDNTFAGSRKLVEQGTSVVSITDAVGRVLNLPVTFATLFTQTQLSDPFSAFGDKGRAVFTTTPNKSIEVSSVRNGQVADDEFRNVSAGIVYAAVGSAFAFVLCLGAIAATIGAKAAAKAAV